MAIVTGESFGQFWFFVYSRVMSGEIRLVTLHHLKKSLLLPPLFWGDSWSLSVNHCECSEWPLSKAVYFNHPVLTANTSIHIIPLVWWKLSVEVFNQGKPWSKRGRNWPKTTPLKSQGQCVLGVCWKVRINECTFRGFLQASFYSLWVCRTEKCDRKYSSGSLSPHTWLLRKCSAAPGVHRPLPFWWTKSVSHTIWILAPFKIKIFRLAFWSGLTTCKIDATI